MSGRWDYTTGGGWADGRGSWGPDCVSLPSLLDGPADVRPVGCTRKATHIIRGSTHCPVMKLFPSLVQVLRMPSPGPMCPQVRGCPGVFHGQCGDAASVFTRPDTYVGGAGPGSSAEPCRQACSGFRHVGLYETWFERLCVNRRLCRPSLPWRTPVFLFRILSLGRRPRWPLMLFRILMIPTLWQRLLRLFRMSVATLTPNPSDSLCRSSLLMPLLGGPALAPWCAEQRPDLVLVQETHLIVGALLA